MRSANKNAVVELLSDFSASSSTPLRVAIVGAGAIGCYLGTMLSQSPVFEVFFIGRERMALEAAAYGLTAQDLHGACYRIVSPAVYTELEVLRDAELVLVTVKARDLESVLPQLVHHLSADCIVVALQNGVSIKPLYQQFLTQTVIRAIVPFNVVKISSGFYARTTGSDMVWQQTADWRIQAVLTQLQRQGIKSKQQDSMKAVEFGKLLLNLNNAINALADIPLQQQLLQRPYRRLLAAAMLELLDLCRRFQMDTYSFTSIPNSYIPLLLQSPNWLFKRLAKKMLAISPDARSSMWDDLQAGKVTEIDFLNGAVVALAAQLKLDAPVNRLLVQLVKRKEQGELVRLCPLHAQQLLQEALKHLSSR
ncbi:2-dehydropantoate 2-reductase [Rheinheimera sediminis]|uniref:2-dehydropantoate 2-reductase n=1 Tax=Rheinheimera sp. YQF-1 TaxID=2499626 RepID=UPI0016454D65|nr:2-dehydropantoate 2-reductase [Rheinheimera sp. YQF-1]